jgi:NADH-quinone oxidoreductase subunit L
MTTSPLDYATLPAAVLATMLPFLAFLLIMIWTRSRPQLSARLSIGAIAMSFGSSLFLLGMHTHLSEPIQYTGRWVGSGSFEIPFGFLIDPLSLLMLVVVAGISLLVQVYSLGYMAGDPGFSRYYAFMSLFAWAMLNLTLAPTILQLYIFWELVGVSSYLLIGFWYERFSATQAGKKAFVMTRAGDVAFFLGVLLVLLTLGNFSILEMNSLGASGHVSPAVLTLASLLIFGGIIGKSAQFPLLTWLPDAMEGPTPVSALLHSATMVAAGVYLFARLFPFFSLSPVAMTFFLLIGTISMLLASTMAMVTRDIKQVWAYSTISQLGFMIMALAAGDYFGGVFHLTTHAGFKALLFLCSGVLIHQFHTNDIFELGGHGSHRLKIPTIAMVIAAGALAGLPPLSGFFSKEVIMAGLAGLSNPLWFAAALLGVFLTAYYSFRVIFIVSLPHNASVIPEGDEHSTDVDHGSEDQHAMQYRFMTWPLIILASVTLLLGLVEPFIRHFLLGQPAGEGAHGGTHVSWVPYAALGLALFGVGLAWLEFGRGGARRVGFVERIPALYNLFAERWYLDHFYRLLVDRVVDKGLARLAHENDNKVIDGSIEGISKGTVEGGRIVAFLHSGMIQYRLLTTFAVIVFLSLYFFF